MSKIKKYLAPIIIVSIFATIGIVVLITNKEKEFTIEDMTYLKSYKINEVIPVYISDDVLAKKYWTNFLTLMLYDVSEAYSLLEDECRDMVFGSENAFKSYVENKKKDGKITYNVKEYGYIYVNEEKMFRIVNDLDETYDFKLHGIMDYEVIIR